MFAPLLMAAALAGQSSTASTPPAPTQRIAHGRIVRVSERPGIGSGILAVYADFDAAPPGGQAQHLYLLWMMPDQFLPAVGAVCTISYRAEPLLGGNWHNHSNRRPASSDDPYHDDGPHNVVQTMDCGVGAQSASARAAGE